VRSLQDLNRWYYSLFFLGGAYEPPSSQAQLHIQILHLLPLRGTVGQGMGVVVSTLHIVSASPSSSVGGLLTLCPCSSMGSLLWDTVLHKLSNVRLSYRLQIFTNCSSMSLFHVCFPQGAVLQEQAAPAWVPHGVIGPASKPALVWAPLSTGLQVLPGGSQSPSGIHLLQRGVFHELQVEICSTVDLHGLQRDRLLHHGLLHGLQGNLCSGTRSTSSTSFFIDPGVCRLVSLTWSHSCLLAAVALFFLFLNMLS